MRRLYLTVEGPTEAVFARRLLAPHLLAHQVNLLGIELAAIAKKKGLVHRGGLVRYAPLRNGLQRYLRHDRHSEAAFSTMFDLYGLPRDFPGMDEMGAQRDPYVRIADLEAAFGKDIGDRRFIPYLQLYEFEAILLSEPSSFAVQYPDRQREVARLVDLCRSFDNRPERIDDGEHSAPSKRIGLEIPEYLHHKRTAGAAIAAHIGLEKIRAKCPHFNEWLTKLERLGSRDRSE
jgi:hypothetical protein